jgi:hypothetical protein
MTEMTPLEWFKMVWESVTHALPSAVGIGPTGYLDQPVSPTASAMRGRDEKGRLFITLCLRSREQNPDDGSIDERAGVLTIFQRYTGKANTIAEGQNHGRVRFLAHAATRTELAHLHQLVVQGRTTLGRDIGDDVEKLEVTTYVLIPPAEALADAR